MRQVFRHGGGEADAAQRSGVPADGDERNHEQRARTQAEVGRGLRGGWRAGGVDLERLERARRNSLHEVGHHLGPGGRGLARVTRRRGGGKRGQLRHRDHVRDRNKDSPAITLDAGGIRLGNIKLAGRFCVSQVVDVGVVQFQERRPDFPKRSQADVAAAQVNNYRFANEFIDHNTGLRRASLVSS